ncbi:hypothetical protein OF820_11435 [Oceanotoga sp. DSM 15011]|uniref:hypothetical protein n=1 Tax=Oceanotoga sp. DSM 15011 TaxID=2984951 RepID=UPI0021F4DCD3|nr:hypothetical protein [Oceanotoga sp. DSM 15011]UYO99663.1 hypothetical protein OF820_11435 [Oceanotoga sp. DSM 15011]
MKKGLILVYLFLGILIYSFNLSIKPIFTTYNEENTNYLFYSVTPVMDFGTLKIGPGVNLYQNEIGGKFYYGVPNRYTEDSTNVYNMFSINYLEISTDFANFKYSFMNEYTHGLGTTMYRYSKKLAKSFDLKIFKEDEYDFSVHYPYEITTYFPFTTKNSATLSWVNLDYNFDIFNTGLLIATNYPYSDYHTDIVSILNVYKPFGPLNLGVEGSVIYTKAEKNNLVYGDTFGFLGGLGAAISFEYVDLRALPIIYLSKYSNLNYLDNNYEKTNNLAQNYDFLVLSEEERLGGIYDISFRYDDILDSYLRYSYEVPFNFSEIQNQKIYSKVYLKSPISEYPFSFEMSYNRILENNELVFDIFKEIFNKNTQFEYSLNYNLLTGLSLSYINYYDHISNEMKGKIALNATYQF